jgi:hypothetical protein
LDQSIVVTIEENLINIVYARTSELIGVGKTLSDLTQDKYRRDEKEIDDILEELEHLCHLVKYYKGATQTTIYLKEEFNGVYNRVQEGKAPVNQEHSRAQGGYSHGTCNMKRDGKVA